MLLGLVVFAFLEQVFFNDIALSVLTMFSNIALFIVIVIQFVCSVSAFELL